MGTRLQALTRELALERDSVASTVETLAAEAESVDDDIWRYVTTAVSTARGAVVNLNQAIELLEESEA